jgi:hypothetical protein
LALEIDESSLWVESSVYSRSVLDLATALLGSSGSPTAFLFTGKIIINCFAGLLPFTICEFEKHVKLK